MASQWIADIFSATQTSIDGGIVRRQTTDVERQASKAEFVSEALANGACLVFETATQMVAVFCPAGFVFHAGALPEAEI